MSPQLHDRLTVIDGLIVSRWDRATFEAMRDGGVTAANCTCSIWEDLPTTLGQMAQWKADLRANDDLLMQVTTTDDIRRAKAAGKMGVILGWQNSSGFGDDLRMVEMFHELGLRVVQLTYNTANSVGCGCYESEDGGLTDFGRDLVAELNRVGILIDLSHVGRRTARETVEASSAPVAYSHCLPSTLKEHPRNKSDEELRHMVEHGGFVGVTLFPPFLARGAEASVNDYVEAIEHVLGICGEESVGIGTDFTQGHDDEFFEYITRDKGHGRKLTEFGEIVNPEGLRRIEDYPNLTAAMQRRGWPEARIERVMGENWFSHLDRVWS